MGFLRMCGGMAVAGVLAAACGGSSFNGLQGGGDGGADGNGGKAEGGADARADATGGDDGGGTTDGAADGSADVVASDGPVDSAGDVTGGDAASDGPAPPCPDVKGFYAMSAVDAQGCGNLNLLALECITQTTCTILFQSRVTAGGSGIDGDPTLQNDGSFSGAALKEGTVNRTGCTGTWDGATSTMTVDCGGAGSSQSCVVALKRTASKCP